jgi:hypothetical protein
VFSEGADDRTERGQRPNILDHHDRRASLNSPSSRSALARSRPSCSRSVDSAISVNSRRPSKRPSSRCRLSLSPGTPGRSQGILRAPERLLAAGPPSRRGQNAPLPSICPLWGPACPRGHLARDAGARSVPWSEGYGLPPGRCSAPQLRSHGQHTLTGGLRARPGGRQAP